VGADECERLGVGFDEVGSGGVDALHARLGAFEVGRLEQVSELVQCELMDVA